MEQSQKCIVLPADGYTNRNAPKINKLENYIKLRRYNLGKFTDQYKQLKRANRNIKGRRFLLKQYPWYDGIATHIRVVDAMDIKSKVKDKCYEAEISEVGRGHSVGLMFELASKPIITQIKCPKCGCIAPLNIHWQCFQCSDAMWEKQK